MSAELRGMVAWVVLSTFQYGFGISELNTLQSTFVCGAPSATCIGLTNEAFGYVTAWFTIGGMVSSLACTSIARAAGAGRRACLLVSSALSLSGGIVLALATSGTGLSVARLLQGLAAGVGVVQVPIYLQELAPPHISGMIGTLNQFSIVIGIFIAQAIGTYVVAVHAPWQYVPLASALVAVVQLVVGYAWAVESPGWLEGEGAAMGMTTAADAAEVRSRLGVAAYTVVEDRARDDAATEFEITSPTMEEHTFCQGMMIVALTQLAQQFSGVNAILYYSTGILSSLLPRMANNVGLLITIVNGIMTLPPLWLIQEEHMGRKRLMVLSAAGMGTFCFALADSMLFGHATLSAMSLICAVAFFSIGLGPVPFVIMPEVLPRSQVSFGSSLGIGINWIANIITAVTFQPLRAAFQAYDGGSGGLVFVVFGVTNMVSAALIAWLYSGPVYRQSIV